MSLMLLIDLIQMPYRFRMIIYPKVNIRKSLDLVHPENGGHFSTTVAAPAVSSQKSRHKTVGEAALCR